VSHREAAVREDTRGKKRERRVGRAAVKRGSMRAQRIGPPKQMEVSAAVTAVSRRFGGLQREIRVSRACGGGPPIFYCFLGGWHACGARNARTYGRAQEARATPNEGLSCGVSTSSV